MGAGQLNNNHVICICMQLLGAAIGWVCIAAVVYLVLQFVRKHKTSTAVAVARAQAEAAAEAAANAEGGDAAALARSEGNTVAIHLHIGKDVSEQETAAMLAQVAEVVEVSSQQSPALTPARILPPAMPVRSHILVEHDE